VSNHVIFYITLFVNLCILARCDYVWKNTQVLIILIHLVSIKGNFSQVAIPLFYGESYNLLLVRMQTYLEELDLWEFMEEDVDDQLLENPSITEIKI